MASARDSYSRPSDRIGSRKPTTAEPKGRRTVPAFIPAHRVGKSSDKLKRGKKHVQHGLQERFEAGIDRTRQGIRQQSESALQSTEDDLNAQLDAFAKEFEAKLQCSVSNQDIICTPLEQEEFLFATPLPGAEKNQEEVTRERMGDYMEGYKQFVIEQQRAIDGLWKEWDTVQENIICLAIEVLGVEQSGVAEHISHAKEKFARAETAHGETRSVYQQVEDDLAGLEDKIKQSFASTKAVIDEQNKNFKLKRQKMVNGVGKLLDEFQMAFDE